MCTFFTVFCVNLIIFVSEVTPVAEFLLGVFVHQVGDQDGLQQTDQHQSKDHDAVGG